MEKTPGQFKKEIRKQKRSDVRLIKMCGKEEFTQQAIRSFEKIFFAVAISSIAKIAKKDVIASRTLH